MRFCGVVFVDRKLTNLSLPPLASTGARGEQQGEFR